MTLASLRGYLRFVSACQSYQLARTVNLKSSEIDGGLRRTISFYAGAHDGEDFLYLSSEVQISRSAFVKGQIITFMELPFLCADLTVE
jgi:hypothetical protein